MNEHRLNTDLHWERADAIMSVIEDSGGYFTSEAGSVLHDLAFLSGVDYKAVSYIVLALEEEGFVEVDRLHRDEPERANIVLTIKAI